jgi:predicted RNase H-like nuclease (RuvC/YqgF family)
MDTIDLLFADNNEVIVDALVSKIREQGEDLEDLQNSVDKLTRSVREVQAINEKLKADLAAAKKAAKAPKAPKSSIISKAEAQKISSAIGKRKPGRPKKAVK